MYDPLELSKKTENIVTNKNMKKYYRFRPTKFYGGISTADVVGCNLRCKFCWSGNSVWNAKNTGRFYSQVYRALYGGELICSIRSACQSPGGEYEPDILIDDSKRKTYVEVKTVSTHKGQFLLRLGQVSGYCYSMVKKPEFDMEAALFNYTAFKPKRAKKLSIAHPNFHPVHLFFVRDVRTGACSTF